MRILLKVLLFPVTLLLSLVVLILNFIVDYGGWVTNILAGLFFLIGLAITIGKLSGKPMLSASWGVCAIPFVFAFLLSPYGLMRLVAVITDGLESLNETLKDI